MPTIFDKKPNLQKGYMWPLKRSVLDESLNDINQFDELVYWYSDRPLDTYYPAITKIYSDLIDYPVLIASYSLSGPRGTARSKNAKIQPRWYLHIHPIKIDLKVSISEQIKKAYLPSLKEWFNKPKNENWYNSSKNIKLILSHNSNSLNLDDSSSKC